jgi:predicted DNA-binding protein (MmcQ/YjbR family)
MPAPHRKALDALRAYALSLPEAKEEFPWGDRVAKVKGKIFVFLGLHGEAGSLSMSVKLPESSEAALEFPWAEPTGYGLGRAAWVSVRLTPKIKPPVEMFRAWIEESYRAVAGKRLARELDGARASPASTKRTSRRRR